MKKVGLNNRDSKISKLEQKVPLQKNPQAQAYAIYKVDKGETRLVSVRFDKLSAERCCHGWGKTAFVKIVFLTETEEKIYQRGF